ncbi:IS21 family transposase [Nocardioides ferulae]|uniref:IS21 family transposase n=1 Tax=Nocardioides ferulae TaxID=2340821 RepID=UPI000EABDE57|nr:IS21 family transposase [Nocardioides ferulae]
MLTREEDIDAHALRRQGWTISAIARHLGRDRKTIRAYLDGGRVAGQRKPAGEDPFEPYVDYVRARLAEDPHLWAVTLFDEVVGLGYDRSYPTFTRQIRTRGLRPHCEPCSATRGRPAAVIEHPPGEETQWDWVELPDPPTSWGWGKHAHLLVGALAHSGKWRGTLAPAEDQAQLIAGLDATARKLGGLTKKWRFDRMTTVCHPESGKVTATFAAVAKHYGVHVAICPPRRGNRKGVVEKSNHTAAQRWWRTLPDDVTITEAQASLDKWCATRGDARLRAAGPSSKASVLTIAEREPLAPVPASPFPATITEERTVSAQALVAWRGNFYSVPPELARAQVTVSQRLGAQHLDIATLGGIVVARHELAPDGAGVMVRDHGHVIALEQHVLAGHDTSRPHRRKERIPPGPAARAAADVLRAAQQPTAVAERDDVVIDLSKYDRAAIGRNTLT